MLNHQGEFLEYSLTPRNENIKVFCEGEENREGGENMCATLFTKNLIQLSLEQAKFLNNMDNWNPSIPNIENFKSEKNKSCEYINLFRSSFKEIVKLKKKAGSIQMMDPRLKEPDRKICLKPTI